MLSEKEDTYKDSHTLDRRTFLILLAGVFLTSLSLLIFEITLTRLLSVMLLYNYVFAVISIVLLGLAAGSIFVHFFRTNIPIGDEKFGSLALFAGLFATSIPLSVILIARIPQMENILVYCLILFIPFFFAGVLLAEVYRMFPELSARVYGADLIGAAVGSLGVVLALDKLGGINTSFFAGFVAGAATLLFFTRMPGKNVKRLIIPVISVSVVSSLLISNLMIHFLPDVPVTTNREKSIHNFLSIYRGKIVETRWSAYGRTDLVESRDYPDLKFLFTDGTAGTLMYKFNGDFETPNIAVKSLKTDSASYFPFLSLREEERNNALIIGSGGGLDILLARLGGVQKVTAIEVSKDIVDIVREYASFNGGIYSGMSDVEIVVDEGRSFLKRQEEKYDVIMLTFPLTQSSRSVEGYALTENYLFTVESIHDYLDHLTDNGRLVVSIHQRDRLLKLLSTSLSALEERGIGTESALKQISLIGSYSYPIFVLKKTPFEPAVASSMYEAATNQPWCDPSSSYFPYVNDENEILDPTFEDLANGKKTIDMVVEEARSQDYDISEVTDNSPFFFKREMGIPKQVSQVFWVAMILMLIAVLVPPLYWMKKGSSRGTSAKSQGGFNRLSFRFVGLFCMLGIGFMLVEISLIQKFVLFLGQPVLSLAVLLFSLLVGAGIGSICSGRLVPERITMGIKTSAIAIVIVLFCYVFLLPVIFNQLLGMGLAVRLLVTVVFLTPLGFLMGFPFPLGIRLLKWMEIENQLPWMWGINGAGSVLGSVMTVIIAINIGYTQALLAGASCYFIVFLIFQGFRPKKGLPALAKDEEVH